MQFFDCEFHWAEDRQLYICVYCGIRRKKNSRRNCQGLQQEIDLGNWRSDSLELLNAGFPLALCYDEQAPKLESQNIQLRSPEEIIAVWEICDKNQCGQYNGRYCSICSGCSGRGERKYLTELVTANGHCLLKDNPLF